MKGKEGSQENASIAVKENDAMHGLENGSSFYRRDQIEQSKFASRHGTDTSSRKQYTGY